MYALGLVFLLVGLIVSVALHELGHLLPAKRFGALVPEYWVGFGPKLFSVRRGGTTYGLKAVLLGGYVRIVGMFAPATALRGKSKARADRQNPESLPAQARLQSAEEVEEISAAEPALSSGKPFYQLRTWQKAVVMAGGPAMNLVLALLLTAIAVVGIGHQTPTTAVGQVVSTTSDMPLAEGTELAPDAVVPAAAAGLQPGDRITSWNGTEATSWEQLVELMEETPAAGADVVFERGGTVHKTTLVPIIDADGQARIGIVAALERQRGDWAEVFQTTGAQIKGTAGAIVGLPVSLWNLTQQLFTDAPRDPAGAMSVVGVARLAGEVSSVEPTNGAEVTLLDRVAILISLLASLNVALLVFNLIPLPPLDGGHIAGALYSGARRGVAKVFRRPDPGPADTARLVPISYAVFALLVGMSLILMVADVVKPLTLT